MPWNNTNGLVVGGTGQVYYGATSASAPSAVTGDPTGFSGLGYHSEDGVSLTVTPNIQEFPVWQSRQPARRESLATEILTSFSLAQFDENTVTLAFGGGTITYPSTTTAKYAFPTDNQALAEVSLVIDVSDTGTGTAKNFRFYWVRGNVTEAVTTQFNRSNLAVLPVGYKALAPTAGGSPGFFLTDSSSFASGSAS